MFNFIIVLNTAPFFILTEDDQQVEEIVKIYKEKVHRVIRGEALVVQSFAPTFILSNHETILIPEIVNEEKQLKLISEEEQDQMVDEISKDL